MGREVCMIFADERPKFPEVVEASAEESAAIAASYLEKAAKELREGDYSHAAVWIESARPWLPSDTHSR